jgi:hypothetical protein
LRAEPVELLEVSPAQLVQAPAAQWRQAESHDALIATIGSTADEPGSFGPVDELDRAVMPEQQALGNVSNGRPLPILVTAYRKQELVLCRREPDGRGLLFAPMEKAAEAGAELEEALVVSVGKIALHVYIVPR